MNRTPLNLLLVSCAIAGLAESTFACPACQIPLEPTWSERYAKADVAFLGKWVKANRAGSGKNSKATSTFEIVQIARNLDGRLKAGRKISMPRFVAGKPGLLFFVTGYTKAAEPNADGKQKSKKQAEPKPADDKLLWYTPFEVNETAFHYITQAPSPEESSSKRLTYYLKFFEFPDKKIADDAYNEFAKAPFKDVKAISGKYSRTDLRKWLNDKETTEVRLGLYGLMLGLCGNDKDAAFLKARFEKNTKDFRFGIEGMIAGYLLLTGEKGLDEIDKIKFLDKTVPLGEVLAAIQGLRIIDTYGKESISTERLKKSFHLTLARPNAAELVIADLARWKDWGLIDRLVQLTKKKGYDYPSFKQTVIRFLITAKNDMPKSAKKKPPHVLKAEQHLAVIKKNDPKNYKHVRLSLQEFGE